jgi:hypothetical protein
LDRGKANGKEQAKAEKSPAHRNARPSNGAPELAARDQQMAAASEPRFGWLAI